MELTKLRKAAEGSAATTEHALLTETLPLAHSGWQYKHSLKHIFIMMIMILMGMMVMMMEYFCSIDMIACTPLRRIPILRYTTHTRVCPLCFNESHFLPDCLRCVLPRCCSFCTTWTHLCTVLMAACDLARAPSPLAAASGSTNPKAIDTTASKTAVNQMDSSSDADADAAVTAADTVSASGYAACSAAVTDSIAQCSKLMHRAQHLLCATEALLQVHIYIYICK